ncbi:SH3 domain-binding protein 5-like protein, partial [Zootermopsis nevadensis]
FQIELEKLNNATDEINRLEIELDEANTTFRLLLNESTRRLKLLSKKLGSCIERARPYYDSLEVAKKAQLECQRAAVQFQRANEFHQAAKETAVLAEQRFLSKQHEWQFDSAWQEMLNHATMKVMDADKQKAECGREHHKRATLFNAAEQKVQELEQRLHRSITKSRPYFEEKASCQGQLATQKERVEALQHAVAKVKSEYAESLKELERISEEIHYKRGSGRLRKVTDDLMLPHGPREPGVGAEINVCRSDVTNKMPILTDYELELDRCDLRSLGSLSVGTSSAVSEKDDSEVVDDDEE